MSVRGRTRGTKAHLVESGDLLSDTESRLMAGSQCDIAGRRVVMTLRMRLLRYVASSPVGATVVRSWTYIPGTLASARILSHSRVFQDLRLLKISIDIERWRSPLELVRGPCLRWTERSLTGWEGGSYRWLPTMRSRPPTTWDRYGFGDNDDVLVGPAGIAIASQFDHYLVQSFII